MTFLRRPVVHPRRVWAGTIVGGAGVCTIGLGLTVTPGWTTWMGVGMVVVGVVLMWWSGAVADIHGQEHGGPKAELDDIIENEPYRGTLPTDRHDEPDALRDAECSTPSSAYTELAQPPATVPARDVVRAAGGGVLISGAWLLVTLPRLAMEPQNHDVGLRQAVAGIALVLLGIRLLMVRGSRPALTAAAAAAVSCALLATVVIWWPASHRAATFGLVGSGLTLASVTTALTAWWRSRGSTESRWVGDTHD